MDRPHLACKCGSRIHIYFKVMHMDQHTNKKRRVINKTSAIPWGGSVRLKMLLIAYCFY